jgi:hypothetical protein
VADAPLTPSERAIAAALARALVAELRSELSALAAPEEDAERRAAPPLVDEGAAHCVSAKP